MLEELKKELSELAGKLDRLKKIESMLLTWVRRSVLWPPGSAN